MNLYLQYETTDSGGDIAEGQENEDFPDRDPRYITFTPEGIYLKELKWGEKLETTETVSKGDRVYLVVVRYSSGDTFGQSFGHWSCVLVTKNRPKAEKCAEDIEWSATMKFNYYCTEEDYAMMEKRSKEAVLLMEKVWGLMYLPWNGHFSRLQDIEIHDFEVL